MKLFFFYTWLCNYCILQHHTQRLSDTKGGHKRKLYDESLTKWKGYNKQWQWAMKQCAGQHMASSCMPNRKNITLWLLVQPWRYASNEAMSINQTESKYYYLCWHLCLIMMSSKQICIAHSNGISTGLSWVNTLSSHVHTYNNNIYSDVSNTKLCNGTWYK